MFLRRISPSISLLLLSISPMFMFNSTIIQALRFMYIHDCGIAVRAQEIGHRMDYYIIM